MSLAFAGADTVIPATQDFDTDATQLFSAEAGSARNVGRPVSLLLLMIQGYSILILEIAGGDEL